MDHVLALCLSLSVTAHPNGPKRAASSAAANARSTKKRNLKSKQSHTIEKWCFYSLPVRINLNGRKMVTQEKNNQNSLCRDHLKDNSTERKIRRRSWNNGPNEHNSQRVPCTTKVSILLSIGTISNHSEKRSSVLFFYGTIQTQRQKPCKSILAFESLLFFNSRSFFRGHYLFIRSEWCFQKGA